MEDEVDEVFEEEELNHFAGRLSNEFSEKEIHLLGNEYIHFCLLEIN